MNDLSREELLRENEQLRAELLHEIRMSNQWQREKDKAALDLDAVMEILGDVKRKHDRCISEHISTSTLTYEHALGILGRYMQFTERMFNNIKLRVRR